jgi:hypothetical protein
MEVISISQISDPNKQQPFTGLSLEFLQNALRKDDAGIIETLVTKIVGSYSLTVPYVISGCVVTDSNKDVTAGKIFYGGKFYETTSVNGTTNVARFILTKTQDTTADPITFSNGSTGSVHDIYKYVPTDTASGGDFIATDLVYLASTSSVIAQQITLSSQLTSSATYVDMTGLTYTTPNDGLTRKYKLTLKSDSDLDGTGGFGSSIAQAFYRIYNDTDSTELDESQTSTVIFVNSSTQDVGAVVTANCTTIVSLAPNKVIKCQFKLSAGTSVTATKAKFFIEEIK